MPFHAATRSVDLLGRTQAVAPQEDGKDFAELVNANPRRGCREAEGGDFAKPICRSALADFHVFFVCVRPVPFAATQLHLQRSFSKSSSIIRLANVAP